MKKKKKTKNKKQNEILSCWTIAGKRYIFYQNLHRDSFFIPFGEFLLNKIHLFEKMKKWILS